MTDRSRLKKKQKKGNERRGNAKAAQQARQNLKNTAKTIEEKITQSSAKTQGSSSYGGNAPARRGGSNSTQRTTSASTSINRRNERQTQYYGGISKGGKVKSTAERMKERTEARELQRDNIRRGNKNAAPHRMDSNVQNSLRDRLKQSQQPDIIKAAAQQQVGGYEKFIGNMTRGEATGKSGAMNRKLGGSSNTRRNDRLKPGQVVGKRPDNTETIKNIQKQRQKSADQISERGSKNIQESSKAIEDIKERNLAGAITYDENGNPVVDKKKKRAGDFKNWMLDLEVAGLQMGGDALLGIGTGGIGGMASMFTRAGGMAMDEAERAGASRDQAIKYGLAIGGVEALTEKIGAVASPLRKVYGKGVTDTLMEKIIGKMTAKTTAGEIGQRTFMSALTEGLEEMVAEGVEPEVANKIYADTVASTRSDEVYNDAISKGYSEEEARRFASEAYNAIHQSTSLADIFRAGSIGAAMGGILGGAGNVIEAGQGAAIKDLYGKDGIREMAKKAKDSDDDTVVARATAILDQIDNGGDVTAGQANAVFNAVQQQEAKDNETMRRYDAGIYAEMRRNGYESPLVEDEENGVVGLNRVASEKYEALAGEALEAANEVIESEEESGAIADAIAAVMTGIASPQQVSMFTTSNPQARAVFESVTGETLPKSNAQMREKLFAMSARNYVETAAEETGYLRDQIRGVLGADMTVDYGSKGQAELTKVLDDETIDPRDPAQAVAVSAFEDYYRAGALGIPMEQILQNGNPQHNTLSMQQRKAAHEAGIRDAQASRSIPEGSIIAMGERIANQKNGTPKGILIDDTKMLRGSERKMYQRLAQNLHINIHVVDHLPGNGKYENGEVYLAMDNESGGLFFVFAHEITHHIKAVSPDSYNKLHKLVEERWSERGGIDEEIKRKTDLYEKAKQKAIAEAEAEGKTLTGAELRGYELDRDDALEEIIADATYEMFGDPEFVKKICTEDRTFGQTILYAIRQVLAQIRMALASGDGYTPYHNAQLLSQLDILSEFEDLWLQGLRDAARAETDAAKGSKLSLKAVEPVKPSSNAWKPGHTFAEVKAAHPTLFELTSDDVEEKNPTSIGTTVSTYRKIYNILQSENFNGTVLDASSGIGKGTEAGREEYGFDVDDIEPFPPDYYSPKYKDYSKLNKTYDAVISNAVLNVVPQDERDNLIVKMGELTKPGGRIFINVRGKDVMTNKSNVAIDEGNMEYFVESTGSYQKGFTPKELKAYVEDALGKEFTVETSKKFGAVSVIATRENAKYSVRDQQSKLDELNEKYPDVKFSIPDRTFDTGFNNEGMELTEGQKEYFKDSKAVDDEGNLVVVYHSTDNGGFTVFDPSMSDDGLSLFFTSNLTMSQSYSRYGGGTTYFNPEDEDFEWDEEGITYPCYLNLKDPLVIDCRDANWNNIVDEGFNTYSIERLQDWEDGESFYRVSEVDGDFSSLLDDGLSLDDLKSIYGDSLANAVSERFGDEEEGQGEFWTFEGEYYDPEEEGYPMSGTTRDWAMEAHDMGCDGVIFKNLMDNGGKSGYGRSTGDVYVAFSSNQVKDVRNENPTEDADIRYSVRDQEYMDAVERGDMETAQRMVDEAAREAGYTTKAYHGTPTGGFTVFKTDYVGNGRVFGNGTYLTSSEAVAEEYSYPNGRAYSRAEKEGVGINKKVYDTYIKIGEDALVFDLDNYVDNGRKQSRKAAMQLIQVDVELDPDKDVVVHNIRDGSDEMSTVYVIKDATRIKSADPVVYDDNGDVIPLSKRFNEDNADIRYSVRDQNKRDTGEKLTEAQFYRLYSAHKLNLRKRDDLEQQIESIKREGFRGDAGFGINTMPASVNSISRYTEEERRQSLRDAGFSEERIDQSIKNLRENPGSGRWVDDTYFPSINIMADKYGGRKGDTVLLVPSHWVYNDERVVNGFKPFDYEVVNVERDFQPYYELYEKAYDGAVEEQRESLNNEGIEELDDGTTARYSVRSWEETKKDKKLKALVDAGHSEEAAQEWIDQIDSIASIILNDPERLDYEADRAHKFRKPNGDYYKYTLDASTLCDKRRYYQGTYDAIQKALPNTPLLDQDVIRLRTMLKDYGYQSPCGICYVESQRKNLGRYASEWLENYENKDQITLADVTSTEGLKNLKKTNPKIAEDFEKAMAAKGVSSPKVVKLRTDYREDIKSMGKSTVQYLNDIGGLRFHSFSDFETVHLIDTMQAILDMTAKGLMGMAYTKVPNFTAVFGGTGIKINQSLILKTDENGNAVHDENGRLVFDDIEGIPFEEASKWRDKHADNVAFICVGKDMETTLELLADDRVDFVIPFHRSKWSAADMKRLGLNGYEDFATGHQENGIFVSEYWDYKRNGKENSETYLKLCADKGIKPVFEQLLVDNGDGSYSLQPDGSTDGYWKLLVEGKMYNHKTGEGVPQKVVEPNFDMDEARRILDEYEGGADTLPVAQDVVDAFVEEYKKEHPEARYSIKETDSEGRKLTEAQREYFKDSKVVDEEGRLKVVYHGTGAYGFNVFYPDRHLGIFFTDSKQVASTYEDEQATDNGGKIGTYEVYLNATNPMVIDAKGQSWDDIQAYTDDDELLGGDTEAWSLIAQERGHDGLIIKNVYDSGLAGAVVSPSTVYVVFDQNQIKNIDNEIPTESGDIRYSVPEEPTPIPNEEDAIDYTNGDDEIYQYEYDGSPYAEAGKNVRFKSYAELRAKVEKLQADKRLTHGRVLDTTSIRKDVENMLRTMASIAEQAGNPVLGLEGKMNKANARLVNDIIKNAKHIYKMMKSGREEEAVIAAMNVADDIVERIQVIDDAEYDTYKEMKKYLRETSITISEEDASNIPDFGTFKKNLFGKVRIVKEGGFPVDSVYEELMELFPGVFDAELTHPADRLMAIADAREAFEPYDVMLTAEEREQLLKDTTMELLDIIADGEPWRSWADKKSEQYQNKVKMLQERHREALRSRTEKERARAERLVQAEKTKAKEKKEKAKDKKERLKAFGSIEKNHKWLSDRLLKPTDDKHIPEDYKIAVADLLMTLDLQTERSKALEEKTGRVAQKTFKFRELLDAYEEIANPEGTGILEYDYTIVSMLKDSLAIKLDGKSVDALDTATMREVDTLLKAIVGNIKNVNKAFAAERDQTIDEMAAQVTADCNHIIDKRGTFSERKKNLKRYFLETSKVINIGMKKPREFFTHLGKGMTDAYMEIRHGEDKHFRNMQVLRGKFESIFKQYNNKKKPGSAIEKWRDTSTLQTFELENGESVKLNIAQVMSLYCLSKREQALGHIYGSGIVPSKVEGISGKIIHKKNEVEGSKVMVTYGDVMKIIDSLTDEQRTMADQLQALLNNEVAAWGNETSMLLYNYEKFTEKNYFPIKSDDAYLDSSFEGRTAEERIRNFGFTKGTITNANNPIVIADIFEVVTDHCNKMSLYNSFAAPLADFTRLYNSKFRNEDGTLNSSVKDMITKAYGKDTHEYIQNFMADVNNNTQVRPDETRAVVNKFLANYKRATIGMNMRVAVQQPTAIVRAFDVIDPKYFVADKQMVAPWRIKRDIKEMCDHCPIALWKSWGHNDVDMARDLDDIMMNKAWSRFDIVTMGTYGALDIWTWSKIWNAVKREIKAKNPGVEVGSDEYWDLCNERASEVFDRTQVVDSVLHRSQTMRSKDTMTKMISSFMAEPTTTFNMLQSDIAEARDLIMEGEKGKAAKKLTRCMTVFGLNAAAVSAAAAVIDLLRGKEPDDDDKDKEGFELWYANFLNNFIDNANPIKMIPYPSTAFELFEGTFGTSNMAFEGWESLAKGLKELQKYLSGDSKKSEFEVMWMVGDGIGNVLGIPVKSVDKDYHALMNRLGISFASEKGSDEKVRVTGDDGSIFEFYPGENMSLTEKFFKMIGVDDNSKIDKFLNKFGINLSEEEKQEQEYQNRKDEILKKCEGLEGEEREKKLWSIITGKKDEENLGITSYIESADFDKVEEMKKLYVACGGDKATFDEKVIKKAKTAYKKTIGVNDAMDRQFDTYDFLIRNGVSEAEISEIVKSSDTAREFKKAYALGDDTSAALMLSYLTDAGLNYEDYEYLCSVASRSVKASDYATGEFDWPTNGTVTSGFGHRSSPGGIGSTNHQGMDIGAASGTPVSSADGGRVISAGWNGGYGNCVIIDHGNGYKTLYGHLSGYEVKQGQIVKKNQQIGKVGSTGNSTGPHLHFGVMENDHYVNPANYLQR